jgi:hypothetical protein
MATEYRKMTENKGFVVVEHIDKLRNDYEEMRTEVSLLKQEFTHLEKMSMQGFKAAQHSFYHWRVNRATILMLILMLCTIVQDRVNMTARTTQEGKNAGSPENNPFLVVTMFVGVPLLAHAMLSLFLNTPLDLSQPVQDPDDVKSDETSAAESCEDNEDNTSQKVESGESTSVAGEINDVIKHDKSPFKNCEDLAADTCAKKESPGKFDI